MLDDFVGWGDSFGDFWDVLEFCVTSPKDLPTEDVLVWDVLTGGFSREELSASYRLKLKFLS